MNPQSPVPNNEAPVERPVIVKGSKERQEYRVNEVVSFQVQEGQQVDAKLESAIAYLQACVEDDGIIDRDEAKELKDQLWQAFVQHGNELHIQTLLDVSGSEAAVREVERIKAKRRNGAKSK